MKKNETKILYCLRYMYNANMYIYNIYICIYTYVIYIMLIQYI